MKKDKSEILRFLETLQPIRVRPAIYFGKDYNITHLRSFVFGYLNGAKAIYQETQTELAIFDQEINMKLKDIEHDIPTFDDYFAAVKEATEEYWPKYKNLVKDFDTKLY